MVRSGKIQMPQIFSKDREHNKQYKINLFSPFLQLHLIFSEVNSPDLPQFIGTRPQNQRFKAGLNLPDRFLYLMPYELFLGYLMPKPFSWKNNSGTI